MRVSVQTERVEKIGHQDQEYKPARLPYLLGARSATVTVGDVSGVRPAGVREPKKGQLLLASWSNRDSDRDIDGSER